MFRLSTKRKFSRVSSNLEYFTNQAKNIRDGFDRFEDPSFFFFFSFALFEKTRGAGVKVGAIETNRVSIKQSFDSITDSSGDTRMSLSS